MTAETSTRVDELRDVAVDVVRAVAAHGVAAGWADADGEDKLSTSEPDGIVRYTEVVVTLPGSMGAKLPPDEVEPVMAVVVAAVEEAGAARGKAILLFNPAGIAARVTVSCFVSGMSPGSPAAPDDSPFDPRAALAAAGRVSSGGVSCQRVEFPDVRTLLESDGGRYAPDSDHQQTDATSASADPIWRVDVVWEGDVVWEAGESASEPSEGERR